MCASPRPSSLSPNCASMELIHILLFASLLGPTPRLTAPTACAVDNGPRPLRSRIASTLTAPVRWSRSERAVAPELEPNANATVRRAEQRVVRLRERVRGPLTPRQQRLRRLRRRVRRLRPRLLQAYRRVAGDEEDEGPIANVTVSANGTIEWWRYVGADGHEYGAVGVSERQCAQWLQHALGVGVGGNVTALREACAIGELPLRERRTHRRLRRLWNDGRLLVRGTRLSDLAEELGGARPERGFRRELAAYARRVQRLSPSRVDSDALLAYVELHSGLPLENLRPQKGRPGDEALEHLRPLLAWFKSHFPYNHPEEVLGNVRPSPRERSFDASRTELQRCEESGRIVRFPRYNHLRKTMEVRDGRCGEYAPLFLQLMRALGWRARLVVDWTDHLWVETLVDGFPLPAPPPPPADGDADDAAAADHEQHGELRVLGARRFEHEVAAGADLPSAAAAAEAATAEAGEAEAAVEEEERPEEEAAEENRRRWRLRRRVLRSREGSARWVQMDPCEGVVDEPEMYAGWGKEHTYVIALGGGGIADVTRDYAADWNATLQRRELSEAQVKRAMRRVRRGRR